jgi:hypothetical protein
MRIRVGGCKSISAWWLRLSRIRRSGVVCEVLRWSWSISKGMCLGNGHSRVHRGPLLASVLLSSKSSLAQCIYDSLRDVKAENGSGRERSWHWFPPSLESLIEFLTDVPIDQCISVHESVVEVASEVNCVRRSDILDYRVEHIYCREFSSGRCLLDIRNVSRYMNSKCICVGEARRFIAFARRGAGEKVRVQ